MDPLTRSEILKILSCIGVAIPTNTKLPLEVLDRRLRDALNAAQNMDNLPISPPLQPEATAKWPVRFRPPERESLKKAVWRGSLEEANEVIAARKRGQEYTRGSFWDPFWDLRQTMMSLGGTIDKGYRWVTIQDPEQEKFSINVRLLPTLQVDIGTPGIVVLYKAFNRFTAIEGVQWAVHQSAIDKAGDPGGNKNMASIRASPLELKLILRLLALNARLLSPSYQPARDRFEEGFQVSILLPIGPLGFHELGRLSNDPGCAVCGRERKSRCSQCQSVSYCSTACQKAHWPEHRDTCLSLKGGRWCTIPFRLCRPGEGGTLASWSNRRDVNYPQPWTDRERRWPKEGDPPPPNLHGERAFLMKLQAPPRVPWVYQAFLLYDRQRSFNEVFFSEEDSPEAYAAFMQEVHGPRGRYGGQKMYRWARRTGDREFAVCLDREPVTDVKW